MERCRIRKLQLLAHQYMIASKIEFYISESLPEYFAPYQSERFQRLGWVRKFWMSLLSWSEKLQGKIVLTVGSVWCGHAVWAAERSWACVALWQSWRCRWIALPGNSSRCFSYEGVLSPRSRNPPVCLDVSSAHVFRFPSQLCPSLRQWEDWFQSSRVEICVHGCSWPVPEADFS